jgi:predicted nucleic acid-binding protein
MSVPSDTITQTTQQKKRKYMSRAITVKVATPKVIKALETKLATIKKDYAEQGANEAKYEKARKAWQKEVVDFAIANIKKAENFRTNYRSYNNTLNIDFDLTVSEKDMPTEPLRDFEQMAQWQYKEVVEEITNALSILRMTDEETVNASTMKQIAKYL